jgi:DNA-binding transcriptional ArsR family regulator
MKQKQRPWKEEIHPLMFGYMCAPTEKERNELREIVKTKYGIPEWTLQNREDKLKLSPLNAWASPEAIERWKKKMAMLVDQWESAAQMEALLQKRLDGVKVNRDAYDTMPVPLKELDLLLGNSQGSKRKWWRQVKNLGLIECNEDGRITYGGFRRFCIQYSYLLLTFQKLAPMLRPKCAPRNYFRATQDGALVDCPQCGGWQGIKQHYEGERAILHCKAGHFIAAFTFRKPQPASN